MTITPRSRPLGRRKAFGACTAIAAAIALAGLLAGPAQGAEELNALVWCDHTDTALIKPFEDKYGVKVNLKEYEGTGTALAIIEQSRPGDWDIFVPQHDRLSFRG